MKSLKKKPKERAIFFDRDGTINVQLYDTDRGIYSAKNLKEFEVIPDVHDAIDRLKKVGFKIIVVSNQPGVAFGYIKKNDLRSIDRLMMTWLGVDAVYNCIHHPKFTGECDCRKPKDGLLKQAANDLNIDLSQSYMIGDDLSDIKAGKDCKETFLIVRRISIPLLNLLDDLNVLPTYLVKSVSFAADHIISHL